MIKSIALGLMAGAATVLVLVATRPVPRLNGIGRVTNVRAEIDSHGDAHLIVAIPPASLPATRPSHGAIDLSKVIEAKLDEVPFRNALGWFHEATGANILVNWHELEAVGIDAEVPVTCHLKDRADRVLPAILGAVSGYTIRLSYSNSENLLTVGPEEAIAGMVETQIFRISDLMLQIRNYQTKFKVTHERPNSLFGAPPKITGLQTESEISDFVVKFIEDSVRSDTWKDNGGAVGSIRYDMGALVVTSLPDVLDDVGQRLDELRRDLPR
jgi:hypothetical protein